MSLWVLKYKSFNLYKLVSGDNEGILGIKNEKSKSFNLYKLVSGDNEGILGIKNEKSK